MTDYISLIESSNVGMFVCQNERFTYVNEAFVLAIGFPSVKEFYETNLSLQDVMPESSYLSVIQEKKKRATEGSANESRYVIECYHQSGKSIYLEVFARTILVHEEETVYGTVIDVSETIRIHQELSLSEQRYRSLFEYNTNLIYSFNTNDEFETMNPAVTRTLGYDYEELKSSDFSRLIHPDDLVHTFANYHEVKKNGQYRSYEARVIHKSGSIIHAHIVNIPIYVNEEIVGVYGIARDITELKSYIQQIEHYAFTDNLTGLPNRRAFEKKSMELFEKHRQCSLALIDLHGLKTINDTLGHDIGDELLKELSHLLKTMTQDTSVSVSRIGGDEFALLDASGNVDQLIRISEKIVRQLKQPVLAGEFEVFVSASIGISCSNGGEFTSSRLIRQADIALYSAKSSGKRNYSVYSETHEAETLKKLTLVRDIQKAITDNQFYMEYQPRYSVNEQRVTSVEALVRWRHPTLGVVSPSEFISIAEESGLIFELGNWVLRTACIEFKSISEQFNISLSVNVSVIQIMNNEFVPGIKTILESVGYPPNMLELEITETAIYKSEETITNFLQELRALNIQVSLDDFGTGYSSLSFIQKYSIDTVKLDRSFIASLTENERNARLFSGILALLQSLDMRVIAEGIETKEQYAYITQLNCNEAQGYLFSRSVKINDLIRVIRQLS
jgi:PAS domain S-box/diguanylate cyclase (GGDEF) domain